MHVHVELGSFLPYNKMLPFQLGRQTSGLRATWLTWDTTGIIYKIRTLFFDNLVEYILFKKIFNFSANILLLNITILFLREHLLFFFIYYRVKIDPPPFNFCPTILLGIMIWKNLNLHLQRIIPHKFQLFSKWFLRRFLKNANNF